MPEHPFTEDIPYLRRFLAARYRRLSDADREDLVQEVCTGVSIRLAHSPGFVPESGWKTYLTRAAINAAIARWRELERIWFRSLADESASPALASAMPSPSALVSEVERRDRQSLLLSDILREYVARCEAKSMQTQKEVYERSLRGQEPTQIADEMDINEDTVYQAKKRARDWVMDRIRQADVDRTVFQTFLRPHRDIPAATHLPDHVPKNFHEVLQRVVDEAGVLCPSDARLALYRATPSDAELRDVRYHVEAAGCELCAANE